MGAGHSHTFYVHRDSALHSMAPQLKIVATIVFVLAVVATPSQAIWAFVVYGALVALAARFGRIRLWHLFKRLVIEVPFLAFAVFLPFVGRGERVEVMEFSLSVAGLWGAWNIVAKGTLGVAAAVVLTGTTSAPEILVALDRLRCPQILVQIANFMIRYMDVIGGDMRRMRIARESRGSNPRWIFQVRAVCISAGALFIRSFERGERVHLAMLSRGYDGRLPDISTDAPHRSEWLAASVLPLVAMGVCSVAWSLH